MIRVEEVKVFEGTTIGMLESEINRFLKNNRNLDIVDIKYTVYDADVDPEFIEDIGKEKEVRFSALLLIGEEF